MDGPLTGRSAVVTGATGYFGASFCEALLGAGARVGCVGRNPDKLDALRGHLAAMFGVERILLYHVDCTDDEAFRGVLRDADAALGGVDILVNNAFEFSQATGFNHPSGSLEKISKDQWMRGLESGLYWHASAIQALIPGMKARGRGSVVNVSSMYGRVAPDPGLYEGRSAFNPPSYATAKAGILGLTRYVASFYGPFGVRCNALLPGAFPNTDPESYNSAQGRDFIDELAGRTVLGRVGRLDDLKGPLLFLASDASAYVTGQELVVDGGWTVR